MNQKKGSGAGHMLDCLPRSYQGASPHLEHYPHNAASSASHDFTSGRAGGSHARPPFPSRGRVGSTEEGGSLQCLSVPVFSCTSTLSADLSIDFISILSS